MTTKQVVVKLGDNSLYINAWKAESVDRDNERQNGLTFETESGKHFGFLSLNNLMQGERRINDLYSLSASDAEALQKFLARDCETEALKTHGLRVTIERVLP